jgi:hypothetical protein
LCDQDRTGEIRPGEGERLWAAPLLLGTVRAPELGQARARVGPGSPELGREGENDTVNSVAGKRPRIRGQRGGMAGKRPQAEQRNSGEGFRPQGGGLRHAKAWDSLSRGRGTLGPTRGHMAGLIWPVTTWARRTATGKLRRSQNWPTTKRNWGN